MKPGGRRLVTHALALAAGAALFTGGRRLHVPTGSGDETSRTRSTVVTAEDDAPSRAARRRRATPTELRQMIESAAALPMTYRQRSYLLRSLLEEWAATDPESLLPWLEKQSWLRRSRWPSLAGLAARKPELIYRSIVEQGDPELLNVWIKGNPAAVLDFRRRGLLPPELANVFPIFESGVATDPTFTRHLQELTDPAERGRAMEAVVSLAQTTGNLGLLRDLWRQHPESVRLDGMISLQIPSQRQMWSALLPDQPLKRDPAADPMQSLAFLRKLQDTYQPGRDPELWRKLLDQGWSNSVYPEDIAALSAVADGSRDPAAIETAARALLRQDVDVRALAESIGEPVFRDACLKVALTGDNYFTDESRQAMIGKISDEALRQEMQRRFPSPAKGPGQ